MGAHARGVEWRVRGAVGGGWRVEKMLKVTKKKVVKIFSDGNFGGWSAS
jgi:hypothetical protein